MSDSALAHEGPTEAKPERRRGGAGSCAVYLVVLVCILAPLSVLAVWLHDTVLDTDQYVSTVAPLAHDSTIQGAIATRITNSLVASTDLEARVADVLPARAPISAPAVVDGIKDVVHDLALRIVQSDQFANLWEQANRRGTPSSSPCSRARTSGTSRRRTVRWSCTWVRSSTG